jgi:NADH-quinone oxidoreductase subunit I
VSLEDALDLVRAAQQEPPVRSRGTIALLEENCTVCMLCARECPDWCLVVEGHTEAAPPARPGGRPRVRNVLDRFAIDWSLCMYCGICVEVCPFDALFWAPALVPAEPERPVEEREALQAWVREVPPPPPLDPGAEPAGEVTAAARLDAVAAARAQERSPR